MEMMGKGGDMAMMGGIIPSQNKRISGILPMIGIRAFVQRQKLPHMQNTFIPEHGLQPDKLDAFFFDVFQKRRIPEVRKTR